ncbi:hypothetical protein, partial [uncultured Jannaschia sp.]|uniref:hypothetical protein n=1 Tax=uncultured Jannaschia sp. TaxID=293347 RepID=UPI0026232F78
MARSPVRERTAQGGRIRDSRRGHILLCFGMLGTAQSLPEDPGDLRRFTALLLAEVKSQAMLIYCPAGHRLGDVPSIRDDQAGVSVHFLPSRRSALA